MIASQKFVNIMSCKLSSGEFHQIYNFVMHWVKNGTDQILRPSGTNVLLAFRHCITLSAVCLNSTGCFRGGSAIMGQNEVKDQGHMDSCLSSCIWFIIGLLQ